MRRKELTSSGCRPASAPPLSSTWEEEKRSRGRGAVGLRRDNPGPQVELASSRSSRLQLIARVGQMGRPRKNKVF